jgi:hypothetical protein
VNPPVLPPCGGVGLPAFDPAIFINQMLLGKNLWLVAGIFVLMQTGKMLFPTVWTIKIMLRFDPLIPLVLGVAGALVGLSNATDPKSEVLMGFVLGFLAAHVFTLGRTTLLGLTGGAPLTPPATLRRS